MYMFYTNVYIVIDGTGLMKIRNPQVADSGRYTCRAKNNHSDTDEWILTVKQRKKIFVKQHSHKILHAVVINAV